MVADYHQKLKDKNNYLGVFGMITVCKDFTVNAL